MHERAGTNWWVDESRRRHRRVDAAIEELDEILLG